MSNYFGAIPIYLGTDYNIRFYPVDNDDAAYEGGTGVLSFYDRLGIHLDDLDITTTETDSGEYTIAIPNDIALEVGRYDLQFVFTTATVKIITYKGVGEVQYKQMGI